ncbi:MAG: HAD hydrolase family protein, partial [Bacteroidales bacterium]|nr:HAD hydrolase family protein [Bacteroidales bacterium]
MKNYKERLKDITTFIFDFDGVLSNGKILVAPNGDQLRMTNAKDGYAIQYAIKQGYNVCIISGGYSESMRARFSEFPAFDIFLKVSDKTKVFAQYMESKNLRPEQVVYMGDDIPDYDAMLMAGLRVCPADAAPEIQHISHYISHK